LLSVIGGSLGGMQALEWAVMYPEAVRSIIPIATCVEHSPWAIAMNHVGRSAILNDPEYRSGNYEPTAIRGLGIARQIGMISYRSDVSFMEKFKRERLDNNRRVFDPENLFQVENYLNYQGGKLMKRFDPNSYIILSRALDLHDLARDRTSLKDALGNIRAKTLCIGINSDILYPSWEQRQIARAIKDAEYREIDSVAGHDAFLIEFDQLEMILQPFLASQT
jgi:homoserine O-acetyltransferase